MPVRPLTSREARAVVDSVGHADHELGAGRDLHYVIERRSGDHLEGLIVTCDDVGVTLVDISTPANTHNSTTWEDVARVTVTGYS